MACGEIEIVWVTWTEWCWKGWGPFKVPWRCTRGEHLERYRYDFAIIRQNLGFFRTHFEGCCEFSGGKFKWSRSCIFCVGNGPDLYNVTKYFKNPLTRVGDCNIGPYSSDDAFLSKREAAMCSARPSRTPIEFDSKCKKC